MNRATRLRHLSFVLVLGASAMMIVPGPVLADTRCSGSAGFQVYENINLGGRSALGCGVGWARSYFGDWNTNLNFWENWNDRISSYQTFNFTGHRVRFWNDSNYSGSYLTTTNNDTVNSVDDYGLFNDRFSSGQILY